MMIKPWVGVGLVVLAIGSFYAVRKTNVLSCVRCLPAGSPAQTRPLNVAWPPQVGQPYPDLEWIDQTGQKIRLSSFKGKVLLIEPVGMNCPACLGWSGTETYGPFQGLSGQAGLHPFEAGFESQTRLAFEDPRIVHVQLLLFNTRMQATTAEDAKAWAEHFHRDRAKNQLVLAGSADLLQPAHYQATYNQVPGFQVVDKDFILRSDATSDNPKTSLWNELVPMIPTLVQEVR